MSETGHPNLRRVQIRTTGIAMITVLVVLIFGAYGLLRLFQRNQIHQVDTSLVATSEFMQSQRAPITEETFPVSAPVGTLAQIVDSRGNIIFATDRLQGAPAIVSVSGSTDPETPRTITIKQVGSARAIAIPYRGNWLLLARSLQSVDASVSTLNTVLLIGLPLLAISLGVVLWLVVGRTLRPVSDALEREQRLVADVSHELRTPLAGVRALLESESHVPAEVELNRLEALSVLTRLESIASGLLAEASHGRADQLHDDELVDLDVVAFSVVAAAAPPLDIAVDISEVSGGQVRGNESDLARMVSNLVTNAIRHATSRVRIVVDEKDDVVTLLVSDDGPGIPAADRERIFERFTRLDDARSHIGDGAGLGLPIARSIVAAHGGTIVTCESAAGGAEFRVTLPASVTESTPRPVSLSNR